MSRALDCKNETPCNMCDNSVLLANASSESELVEECDVTLLTQDTTALGIYLHNNASLESID